MSITFDPVVCVRMLLLATSNPAECVVGRCSLAQGPTPLCCVQVGGTAKTKIGEFPGPERVQSPAVLQNSLSHEQVALKTLP
eukprot:8402005-Pyramimonas_sp.AAC.1